MLKRFLGTFEHLSQSQAFKIATAIVVNSMAYQFQIFIQLVQLSYRYFQYKSIPRG